MEKRMSKLENQVSLLDHKTKENENQSSRLEVRLETIEKSLLSIKHTIYGAAGVLIVMEFGLKETFNLFK